jgi:hypothetical protein
LWLTDDSTSKISHNAKFAAVHCKIIYMGFCTAGNTASTPTSFVDGYAYSRSEVMYIPISLVALACGRVHTRLSRVPDAVELGQLHKQPCCLS